MGTPIYWFDRWGLVLGCHVSSKHFFTKSCPPWKKLELGRVLHTWGYAWRTMARVALPLGEAFN